MGAVNHLVRNSRNGSSAFWPRFWPSDRGRPGPDSVIIADVQKMITGIGLTPIEAVLVLSALALLSARWLSPRFRRPAAIGAAASSFASAAVLAVAGLRWQLIPVLAAVVAVLPFTARTVLGKPGGRRFRW